MAGNTFGTLLRVTTYGESHGGAVGVVIDGFPAGFVLDLKKIQDELNLRRPGQKNVIGTKRDEKDTLKPLSGFYVGSLAPPPRCLISPLNLNENLRLTSTKEPDSKAR